VHGTKREAQLGIDAPAGRARRRHADRGNSSSIQQQIIPHLGALPLQKLRASHVAAWHVLLLRSGEKDGRTLSARSVGHANAFDACSFRAQLSG
jgi:hypothetical protein